MQGQQPVDPLGHRHPAGRRIPRIGRNRRQMRQMGDQPALLQNGQIECTGRVTQHAVFQKRRLGIGLHPRHRPAPCQNRRDPGQQQARQPGPDQIEQQKGPGDAAPRITGQRRDGADRTEADQPRAFRQQQRQRYRRADKVDQHLEHGELAGAAGHAAGQQRHVERRAEIGTEGERDRLFGPEQAGTGQRDADHAHGRRRLHRQDQQGGRQEDQDVVAADRRHGAGHDLQPGDRHRALTEQAQPEQQQPGAEQGRELVPPGREAGAGHRNARQADDGIDHDPDIEGRHEQQATDPDIDAGHDHHRPFGPDQRRADHARQDEGGDLGGLGDGRHHQPHAGRLQRAVGAAGNRHTDPAARQAFQGIAQRAGTEEEQAQPGQGRGNVEQHST